MGAHLSRLLVVLVVAIVASAPACSDSKALFDAISSFNTAAVKQLVAAKENVNVRGETRRDSGVRPTPLYVAVEQNSLEIVQVLVAAGARVDEELTATRGRGYRETAAVLAARLGRNGILDLLLTKGANRKDVEAFRTARDVLFAAVRADNLDEVRRLLGAKSEVEVADVDSELFRQTGIGETPLYIAVDRGNQAMVTALVSAGARLDRDFSTIPFGGPPYPQTVAVLAAQKGDWALLDLLLSSGARRADVDQYLRESMQNALSSGRADLAEQLLASGRAQLKPDPVSAYLYEVGSPEIRALVGKYVPEVASGAASLLRLLLKTGKAESSINPPAGAGRTPLPLATSTLSDAKVPDRYIASRAFDGDLATSWVEGVPGDGIGESVAFAIPPGASRISIVPGYGDARFFGANNRLKTATLVYYALRNVASQGLRADSDLVYLERLTTQDLVFDDTLKAQEFALRLPKLAPQEYRTDIGNDRLIGVLEIRSIYTGSQFRDTCVAEIVVR